MSHQHAHICQCSQSLDQPKFAETYDSSCDKYLVFNCGSQLASSRLVLQMLIYHKSLTFDHKVLKMLTEYSRIDFGYLYGDHFTSGISSMINYKIGPFVSQSTKGSIRMFLHMYHLLKLDAKYSSH